ncbi:hypothetical protein RZS08_36450, partial [Arthrospira platensis SPKY1]|nr:hypothetical protein [Arthrospira platensis SPKY1]
MQAAIKALIQALANPAQVRDPGQLQKLVENSGLFQENKLARALLQPQRSADQPSAGSGSATPGRSDANPPVRSAATQVVAQQMKDWISRIKPGPTPATEMSGDSGRPGTAAST